MQARQPYLHAGLVHSFLNTHSPPVAAILLATFAACALAMKAMHAAQTSTLATPLKKNIATARRNKLEFPLAKECMSWLPSLLVPALAAHDCLRMTKIALQNPKYAMDVPAGPGTFAAVAAIVGYMLFDCCVLLKWAEESKASMGTEMYYVIWFHHLLSVCLWPLAIQCDTGSALIGWFLISESSNLTLMLRTVMLKLNLGSHFMFAPLTLLWILHFTVTRIVPLPLLVYFLASAEIGHKSPALRFFSYFTGPLPLLLNMYWFVLIVIGVSTRFFGKQRRE